ncbi:MAG: DUF4330 domain-containing protein [Clostridia bacterium]|nr:DUF4330 domain-containing protein [Clostridia bacterium]
MKIVNEKGKLFGIINPVDLIVILAIVALVFALGVKFLRTPVEAVVSNKQEMEITLRVRGAMPSLVAATSAIEPGAKLVAGNDYIADVSVVSVSVEDYVYTVADAEGVTVETVDPMKKDLIIVIKGVGSPSDAILKVGNQEVRTGRGFIFKTNTVEVNTTIESVIFNG